MQMVLVGQVVQAVQVGQVAQMGQEVRGRTTHVTIYIIDQLHSCRVNPTELRTSTSQEKVCTTES